MFRSAAVAFTLLTLAAGCSSGGGGDRAPSSRAGSAAVTVAVTPNPIIATQMADGRWDFPFRVRISEHNGVGVEIEQVRADVMAFGGIRVHQQTLTRDEIQRLGYPVTIEPNGAIELPFRPQRNVPDPSLFSSVTATVTLEGRDTNGNRVRADTAVSVTPRM